MGEIADGARKAVANLLLNCAKGEFGQSVMIVHEPKDEQFYDPALPEFVAEKVRDLGFEVGLHEVPFQKEVKDPSSELINAMNLIMNISQFEHCKKSFLESNQKDGWR